MNFSDISRKYSSSAYRISNQNKVTAGEPAMDIDTGNIYVRTTSGWQQAGTAGVRYSGEPDYSFVKYAGSGYTYLCEAPLGTARSTAAWRVERVTDATGDSVYAGVAGTTVGTFAFAATDLTTVAGLTYTLGA